MSNEQIRVQAAQAAEQLLDAAGARAGQILVVGCSSSEIVGGSIGHASAPEVALEVYDAIARACDARGVYLAAQCCEHLNRALIVERACAEQYGLEEVCVLPQPKAGGSFATAAWTCMKEPVAVEHIKAHMGMDIGGTLIGMHLCHVAVPVRIAQNRIGEASLLCARTRPKFVGGSRAVYPESDNR